MGTTLPENPATGPAVAQQSLQRPQRRSKTEALAKKGV